MRIMRMVKAAFEGRSAKAEVQKVEEGTEGGQEAEVAKEAAEGVEVDATGSGRWQYAVCLTKSDKGGPKAIKRVEEQVRRV